MPVESRLVAMVKWHGRRPIEYFAKHDFLGPRFIAAHCRYVNAAEIALLGRSKSIVSHQPGMAGNRGANPPIPELRDAGVAPRKRGRRVKEAPRAA